MTLYNHFKSKEELILAALRHMDQQWRESFVAAVERRASKPADRLLALFDALEEWFGREDFCGCACVKACCEFPGVKEPAHRIAGQHHQMVYSYVRGLAADAGAPDPDMLATRLMLLVRGAIVWAQISGKVDAASQAREAGEVLIRDVIGRTSRGKSRKTL